MIKTIIKLIPIISLALIFSACDDKNANFVKDAVSTTPFTDRSNVDLISIVTCDSNNTSFTDIQSGDILVQIDTNTSVDIRHYSDDSKKVCVLYGQAYLERVGE